MAHRQVDPRIPTTPRVCLERGRWEGRIHYDARTERVASRSRLLSNGVDVFEVREQLVADYSSFTSSFVEPRDSRINRLLEHRDELGRQWPQPWLSLNPNFAPGGTVDDVVAAGLLHHEAAKIFRAKADQALPVRLVLGFAEGGVPSDLVVAEAPSLTRANARQPGSWAGFVRGASRRWASADAEPLRALLRDLAQSGGGVVTSLPPGCG